jgi:hypothetical protein
VENSLQQLSAFSHHAQSKAKEPSPSMLNQGQRSYNRTLCRGSNQFFVL